MGLIEKANKTIELRTQYTNAYQNGDIEAGKKIELEYLKLRSEVLGEVDDEVARQRSMPISKVKERVAAKPKRPKRETGIRSLDRALVSDRDAMFGKVGGFAVGSYVQIAGSRGAGKTSIMMKIMTGLSLVERVCWFDFEIGQKRVTEKIEAFTHNDTNLLYYNASRDLDDVIGEIKLLQATGVEHFVIDSTMKISVSGVHDRYERYSTISQRLSELTSTLGINIYIINQMSQSAERDGVLAIKHGNDAEYDADYIIYVLKKRIIENGKAKKDQYGMNLFDETMRLIRIEKNREDDRTLTVEVPKDEIFQSEPTIIEYQEEL